MPFFCKECCKFAPKLKFTIMHRKLLIVVLVMSILAFAASLYLCVVMPDATSYVLAALFLVSAVFFYKQIKNS